MNETRSIKILLTTYRRLKVLAALSGETLQALVDRLSVQEERVRSQVRSGAQEAGGKDAEASESDG